MNFKAQWIKLCTITTSASEGGTITPTKKIDPSDPWAQTTVINITPNPGYKIKDVKVDGVSQGNISRITFTTDDYSEDHTVTAEFEPLTYTLTIVNGDDTQTSTVGYGKRNAPVAPTKEGYVFDGWKVNDTDTIYYADEEFNVTDNMTLTAQWKPIENYVETVTSSNKLSVDVQIKVADNISTENHDEIVKDIKNTLQKILNNENVDGVANAATLRNMLNVGAPKTEVVLTAAAAAKNDWDDSSSAIKEQMTADETAKLWNLTVALSITNKDSSNAQIGETATVNVTKTATPIEFKLTTGNDLTGKTVRVLYLHNSEVKTAESSVSDAANGVVTVTANEFSPYAILSKTKRSSSGGSSSSSTTYPITVTKPANGTLTADKSTAAKGTTVTVTAKANDGYTLSGVTVTDKDGKQLTVTDKGSGRYIFTMPDGKVTVAAAFTADEQHSAYDTCKKDENCPIYPFNDAKTTAWYHDGVHYCLNNGLMIGTSSNTFTPDGDITRGQIVTILWRQAGSPAASGTAFDDVADSAYYAQAVAWASKNGVVTGYGNGKFGPTDAITREQLAAILYRYAQFKGVDTANSGVSLDAFDDDASVSTYAHPAMQWSIANKIVTGVTTTTLAPKGMATRAQAAAMLMRFCENI